MKILKLDPGVGLGVSGLGDFSATASSKFSQNRKVGEEIFTRGKSSIPSEGLVSLPSLVKILGQKTKELPLLSLAEKVLIKNKDPKTEIEKYFK
jgi:glycerol-3-phosphate dehydrogenase